MGMETSGMERMESEMAHPCNLGYQVAVQGLKSESNAVPMKKTLIHIFSSYWSQCSKGGVPVVSANLFWLAA